MVRQAALDLEFTELRAPITGRIGDRRVTQGNLVTGGAGGATTMLATIVSIDPIRFEFTFDEASLLRYQRLATGNTEMTGLGNTTVRLKLPDAPDSSPSSRMDVGDTRGAGGIPAGERPCRQNDRQDRLSGAVCASRISSSIGRFSPPSSLSCS